MMKFRSGIILFMLISIWGCSNSNDSSIVLDASGKHPDGWVVAATGGLHPAAFLANQNGCVECHGSAQDSNASGGISGVSCFSASRNGISCHPQGPGGHPAGWSAPSSHGAAAKTDASGFAYCSLCHGATFAGGAGKSCMTCHTTAPHPIAAHWRSTGTITHTNTGLTNAPVCATCHNSSSPNLAAPNLARFANSPAGSFNGGSPDCFSASMCHGDVRKTSNCDACHSTATTNPFKSMAGATAVTDSKVGAHVKHLSAAAQAPAYSSNVACTECHSVPTSPAVSGTHRNGTNDIVFGTLAKTGSLTPAYAPATGICANTYCHGTSLSGGTNKSPKWNQTDYLTASGCATCHGFPPTTLRSGGAHPSSTSCSSCHAHVNATNNGFTDPTKHINGSVEASGGAPHAFPNPGSLHKSASFGTGCLGCHSLGSTSSTYPVTSGTAPDCRACHLTANPGTDPQCSDCHGSVANNTASATLAGRPIGGTAFPNRPGQHNRAEHVGRACTVCHPFTAGDSRHGWSNRLKSSAAQVGGAGTSITSWDATTKSCAPACHGTETW